MAVNIANVRLARGTGSRAWISGLAALSTAIALIVLYVEVDENPATRNHLWIPVGMILVSFGIEFAYRRVTGRRLDLDPKAAESGAETAQLRELRKNRAPAFESNQKNNKEK